MRFGLTFLINGSQVYGADTKVLQVTKYRPYNDDNGDGTTGNDSYTVQRSSITHTAFKIYENGTSGFPDAIYCLRGGLGFGDENGNIASNAVTYTLVGDMREDEATVRQKYKDITGVTISDANYNSILWIIDHMYLPKHKAYDNGVYSETKSVQERAELREKLLTAAGISSTTTKLTDDDIEVIQQLALWYFSNYDEQSNLNSLSIDLSSTGDAISNLFAINGDNDCFADRKNDMDKLFRYFRDGALANNSTSAVVAPTITLQAINPEIKTVTLSPGGAYYIAGPFKITGTGSTDYTLDCTLTYSDNGQTETIEIDNRTGMAFISDANGNSDRDKELEDMVNQGEFYIAIKQLFYPSLEELRLNLTYSYWKTTTADLWVAGDDDQPVVIIEKTKITASSSVGIQNQEYDLALRKFIVKVNDTLLKTGDKYNREPQVDVSKLMDGTATTATYTHTKTPVEVKTGDKVAYIIRIYNEGDIAGKALKVTDYLPTGLKLAEGSTINNTYGWTADATGKIVTTEYLKNTEIPAFNKTTGEISYVDLCIECEVIAQVGTVDQRLRNIAEITSDDGDDRDSTPDNVNTDRYTPPTDNSSYQEDDDDYEDLILPGVIYDLSLRKFITKVNDTELKTGGKYDREPEVDVSKLINGTATTATYTHTKDPVLVETSDKVVYAIRVYNEGDVVGKALEVTDYLPTGLKFVEGSAINSTYGWTVDGTGKIVTTEYLKNTEIPAFNKTTGEISYVDLYIECEVIAQVGTVDQKLRNIAEITSDDGDDRDSTPDNVNPDNYTPPTDNSSYQEDDDDYEDLVLPGVTFDLALRKFITKINGNELTGESSRVPEINIEALRKRTGTTATYTHSKDPITVKQGDIVTYTIRVYNEGDTDGYVSEITDYIPEGLGLLKDYSTNFENGWKLPTELPEGSEIINLVGENGFYTDESKVKNLTVEDFEGISSLSEVQIIAGELPITTNTLKRDNLDVASTLIKAYKPETTASDVSSGDLWQQTSEQGKTDGLYYKEVEVVCIVLAPNTYQGTLRNITEISGAQDENGNSMNNTGDDRDSTPDNVNTDNYTPPTDNSSYQEDDDDYEPLILKYFDLALRKFITAVNEEEVTSRIPKVTVDENGKITYNHTKVPVQVANTDIVTYTIRVYNEGTIAGYAEEIKDDIPEGLEFLPENATNIKYEWKMYYEDEDGELVETDDVTKATQIRTDYLSSAKETASRLTELQPFDPAKAISDVAPLNPDYKDVKVAFKIVESEAGSDRIITNVAEISKDSDDDEDSTPDNDDPNEDDQDEEHVYVKYFDLALIKWVSKVILTVDGTTTTTNYSMPSDDPGSDYIVKVDLDKKKLSKTTLKFVYTIKIINEGQIAGYATEITDYIPEGLEFIAEDNPLWTKVGEDKVTTRALENTLLQPGENATVDITFTWKNSSENVDLKTNIAEISEDYNEKGSPDIDSTPNNQIPEEDDQDYALVLIAMRTGGNLVYMPVIGTALIILLGGAYLVKRYVIGI